MGTNLTLKKKVWFDKGAASYALVRPNVSSAPVYPCPLCLNLFTEDALSDGRLCAEDVPPKSMGGRPLLLNCKPCNNTTGKSIDADALDRENLRNVMAGQGTRRVAALIEGRVVRVDIDMKAGKLDVPADHNPPDTREFLRRAAPKGSQLTIDYQPRSELGKNISWFKSGYLVLVAEYGFGIAFDPAMTIVREQIIDHDQARMPTFLSEWPEDVPVSLRRIFRVLSPKDHNGWTVQIGRFFLEYPLKGDMTFYRRLARHAGVKTHRTLKLMETPVQAWFGLKSEVSLAG